MKDYARRRSNWGRWGTDGSKGAPGTLGPSARVAAARLVQSGTILSLARPLRPGVTAGLQNYRFQRASFGDGDFVGQKDAWDIDIHGSSITHLDALNHVVLEGKLWDGREAAQESTEDGCRWGDIDAWAEGILTRGVLVDVPRFRRAKYVDRERPVTASDLEAAAAAQHLRIAPGDALVVHCGREAWDREHLPYGTERTSTGEHAAPGLDGSCLEFIRDREISVLVWDMIDASPQSTIAPVHLALWAFGVAIVDNALIEPLAAACVREERTDFALVLAPLRLVGGTGSPINPLALL